MQKTRRTATPARAARRGGAVPALPAALLRWRSGWRLWLARLVLMIAVPALVLGAVEAALRLAGAGYPTSFLIPQVLNGERVYVENQKFTWLFFPPGLARTIEPIVLTRVKGTNTCRIFVLGSSAAQGVPDPSFSVARVLEVMLRQAHPGVRFEVINTGITAINSHAVRLIARECAGCGADAFVVYMGNNEVVGPFGAGTVLTAGRPGRAMIRAGLALKTMRIGQVLARWLAPRSLPAGWHGMEMFLDRQVRRDDPELPRVYRNFQSNLEDICAAAAAARVPLVVASVASNLRDCPPFASLHRRDLSAPGAAAWEQAYRAGIACESTGDYAQAAARYEQAASIDDQYAELHYRLARCNGALGRADAAREHYLAARDLDTLRFRADTRINEIIRATCGARSGAGVHLADAEHEFARCSERGAPGGDLFHEHVHLTLDGTYLLAAALLPQLEQALPAWVRRSAPQQGAPLPAGDCRAALCYTAFDEQRILKNLLATGINRAPFTSQLEHRERVAQLEQRVADLARQLSPEAVRAIDETYTHAIQAAPTDWRLHANYAAFLTSHGTPARALEEWNAVVRLVPLNGAAYDNIAKLLLVMGRIDEAIAHYTMELQITPCNATICNNIGFAYLQQGKHAAAAASFQRALGYDPANATSCNDLGIVAYQQNRIDAAIAYFERALRLDPESDTAHSNLAVLLAGKDRLDEAAAHYRAALRSDPGNAMMHFGLGLVYERQQQRDAAIAELRSALERQPAYPEAAAALQRLLQAR